MVLKKRLDYGFNGFQVPAVPRAPRSLRKRDSFKKQVGDGQICAFELLAAVAGKLLQECESSSASSNDAEVKHQLGVGDDAIKQEQQDDDNILRTELHAHVSCEESAIVSEHSSQEHNKYILKEFLHVESDVVLERTSTVTNSDSSEKVGTNLKVAIGKNKNAYGISPGKGEGGSPGFGESCGGKIENGIEKQPEAGGDEAVGLTVANNHSIKNPMGLRIKHSALANSDSKVESPICRNPIPNASFHRHRNDVNLGIRDDDENSYRCKQSSTKLKAFRPSPRVGDRRIRKILTSKYWKVAPKLKEFDFRDTDRETKRVCHNRKTYYSREKFQHDRPFKKRKLFDQSSVVTSDGGVSSETYSNSPGKGMNGDKSDSDDLLREANKVPSSVRGHQASFQSRDSHVRFSIKSFRVPELFIEVPETATVGSLKRTVMEAVAAILHGGLDVGVLLRGKKVKDDNRTLLQTGISHNDNLDTLGFTLEPGSHAPSPLCAEDPPLLLPSDTPQQLTRSPMTKLLDSGDSDASSDPSPVVDLGNHVESDYDFVPSPSLSTDKTVPESRALVPLPAMNVEALAVVPMNQKTRRSELVQRRTRRPFSVSEVEALVHAVEKLGTGRWRDVKLRAFDNANHRTYVDLKDKWKTLVHTAQISPQQRRGEPVPQELLDRVLAAHSYWSHHQAKHHGKHQAGNLKITDNQTEMDVD